VTLGLARRVVQSSELAWSTRGGYNVCPREAEEALYEHPAVAKAAVIGVAHADPGEEIGAAADPDELRDFVRDRLAAYKYPRSVWLVDALPKGPTARSSAAPSHPRPSEEADTRVIRRRRARR
jgi:non-ribosomal peptide synthetase component E (peptide arylation enzyme)